MTSDTHAANAGCLPIMPDTLLWKLGHPAEPHQAIEHTGDKIVRLTTELLAEMRSLHQYGYMAADDAAGAEAGLLAMEWAGNMDEFSAQSEIKKLRQWFTWLLEEWQAEWNETGRHECAAAGENSPKYFG